MLLAAAKKLGVDLSRSFMVGDKITDPITGMRLGAKGILVLTGYGKGECAYHRSQWPLEPDFIARDLAGADPGGNGCPAGRSSQKHKAGEG